MGPMVHMEHGTTVNGSLQQCGWADVVLAFLMDETGQPLRPMDILRTAAQKIEIYECVCAVCTMCSYEDPAFLSTILADQAPKPAIPCSTILLVNFQHLICWNERMKLMFRSPLSRFLLGLVGKGPLISSGSMKSNLSRLILHRMIYLVDCSAVSKAKSISYVDVAFTTENNGNAIGKTNKSD